MYKLKKIIKKYTSENNIKLVIDFFDANNIKNLNFSDETIVPLNFFNQMGGKANSFIIEVSSEKNKYKIRLYKYVEKDEKNFKTINFIKINSELQEDGDFGNGDQCGVLIIDTKNKESNIQSINNYEDCIACYYGENKKYKIGNILIQVMISMSINKDMEKIRLHDNSNSNCNGRNLPLIILRTMTHGSPLYTKYGFLPLDHNENNENEYKKNELKIYVDNKKNFKSQPNLTKKELQQIIYYAKFDKNKDKNIVYYIENIIMPRLKEKNNCIAEFINNVINDFLIYQKEINNINKNEKSKAKDEILCLSSSCELLDNILTVLYLKCGYYKYIEKTFELNLNNSEIIKDYKKNLNLQ